MAVMARAAERLGWAESGCAGRIQAVLRAHGLPTVTAYAPRELAAAALADKKRRGESITLVIPEAIGRCTLRKVSVGELEGIFQAGWEE